VHNGVVNSRLKEDDGLDYIYHPAYAAGRVVVSAMMDALLFQLLRNPSAYRIFSLLCGIRTTKDYENEKILGIEPAFLGQIFVPRVFVVI
jgi:hypothetical protein